jgi:hypothetical protein
VDSLSATIIGGLAVLVIAGSAKAFWQRRVRRFSASEREVLRLLLDDGTGQPGFVVRSMGNPPPVQVLLGQVHVNNQDQPERVNELIAALNSLCAKGLVVAESTGPGSERFSLTPAGFGIARTVKP